VRLTRLYPGSKVLSGANAITVPLPKVDGEPLPDAGLVEWVGRLLTAVFAKAPAATQPAS